MSRSNRRTPGYVRGAILGGTLGLLLLSLTLTSCFRSPTAASTPRNSAPLASAHVAPDSGDAPLTTTFDGSASDPDGSIASYQWNFGDGTTANTPRTSHVYEGSGTYTATLTATDNEGAISTARVTVRVKGNKAPSATISATPMAGTAPLPVNFTGTGTDVDGTIASYAWSFGDGGTSTEQNPSHTYVNPGNYTVRLVVTDNNGSRGRDMMKIAVAGTTNQPPTASASATPTSGLAPLPVSFTGTGNDADGTIASYAWTFGDGGTSMVQNPSHTYATAGAFTARLTVTDNAGATAAATVAIVVTSSTPTNLAPVANAGPDQLNKDPGTLVTLTGTGSTDPDGSIATYAWTQISGTAVTLSGASTATPSFTSAARTTATYRFRLTVTDNGTPAMSSSDTVTVSTRVTYVNAIASLLAARGTQPNGTTLGCTGCHSGGGGRTPLTTYPEVYSARTAVRSRISTGGSMLQYLLTGEAAVIISWIDAGSPERN